MYRRGEEALEGKVEHREEGGATEVHAKPTEARPVRHTKGGRHVPGELDGRIRLSGTGASPGGNHDRARGDRQAKEAAAEEKAVKQ